MAGETATNSLIVTKLHRPPVADDHLHRQGLLDRLTQRRYRPLALVSAPAGYGKSTLLSCWLESCDIPAAWVPTATDDTLGSDKWGAGVSVVLLAMPGRWVVGSLFSNVWSFAGSGDQDVNNFTWQYFINYMQKIDGFI